MVLGRKEPPMRLQKNGSLVKWGVNALETMGEIFQNERGGKGDLIDKQRAHGLEKKRAKQER